MSLNLEQKQAVVAEVAQIAAKAYSAIAADYRGITVESLTGLRVKARKSGVYLRVVKNTLARRALEGTEFACMGPQLKGPLVLAFSQEDPGAAARVLEEFAKANEKFVVKVIALGGKLVDPKDIKRVASLPTKPEAISLLMAVMKAPIGKLAGTLREVPSKLVRTVDAVRAQKAGA